MWPEVEPAGRRASPDAGRVSGRTKRRRTRTRSAAGSAEGRRSSGVARSPSAASTACARAESTTTASILAARDADPRDEAIGGDLGLVRPDPHEVDDRVAESLGNPAAAQGSPSSFWLDL